MIEGIIRQKLLRENKNFILVITGSPGSGKSWASLTIAERVDPCFTIDQIATPTEERSFISLINSGTLRKGSMVVMEEGGITLPARDWQSFSNKAINTVLQTFRHENIGLIINVPSWTFIDNQARMLCHGYGEMAGINRKYDYAFMKYFNISFSGRSGKIYFKYPFLNINGRMVQQKSIAIPKPSDELLAEYEPLHKKFKIRVRQDLEWEIKNRKQRDMEKAEAKKRIDIEECIGIVQKNKDKFTNTYNQRTYLDANLIQAHFKCTIIEAKTIKAIGEKAL